MRKIALLIVAGLSVLCVGSYAFQAWRENALMDDILNKERIASNDFGRSLTPLDVHGSDGIKEISKLDLIRLMTRSRPLTKGEQTNLDRGCLGLTCVYQGPGLRRWPESARGTVAYLSRDDAINRRCPERQENFVFIKQGWWLAAIPPIPDGTNREVSPDSVTRVKVGAYTFNYAVYFPSTETYAWMNHREYGFPVNLHSSAEGFLVIVATAARRNTHRSGLLFDLPVGH